MRLCCGSGSSVRRASPAPSCYGSPPSIRSSRSSWPPPTRRPGSPRRRSIPAWPPPTRGSCSRPSTPIRSTGSMWCSSACRTRHRWRSRPQLVGRVGCVVDLSAAYRLKDAAQYPAYYGFEHDQQALLAEAVYGLPELHRDELKGARLIATPGCYVTAATLALRPLVERGADRDEGRDRRRRLRRHRRRPQDRPRLQLHHCRRELHRLRAARPIATRRRWSRRSASSCCSRRIWRR